MGSRSTRQIVEKLRSLDQTIEIDASGLTKVLNERRQQMHRSRRKRVVGGLTVAACLAAWAIVTLPDSSSPSLDVNQAMVDRADRPADDFSIARWELSRELRDQELELRDLRSSLRRLNHENESNQFSLIRESMSRNFDLPPNRLPNSKSLQF